MLNSDAGIYGGSNVGNLGGVMAEESKWHNQPCSAEFTLPPLSVIAFEAEPESEAAPETESPAAKVEIAPDAATPPDPAPTVPLPTNAD